MDRLKLEGKKTDFYVLTPFGWTRAGVPNLSLTTYPYSISTDKHVPLQNFER